MSKCPKCKAKLMQQLSVFVEAPANCTNLSKRGIASKDVTVMGVGWDTAYIYCSKGCGYSIRLGKKKNARD